MSEEKAELMMPKGDELVLSSSPHIQVNEHVNSIMLKVIVALLPAVAAGIWFFGVGALRVIVLTMIFCVGAEALWCRLAKKPVFSTICDGSAALTGLLLALNLSAGTAWWICLIGAFLAIWLGKQVYGGLGHNPFNPALVARVGLLIALPAAMTSWVPASGMVPEKGEYAEVFYTQEQWQSLENAPAMSDRPVAEARPARPRLDAMTCATPLGIVGTTPKITDQGVSARENFKSVDNSEARWNYFLGNVGGCLGETSALALLIGGILLLAWRLINWRVPVFYIGTVFVFTAVVNYFYPGVTPGPVFHLLTGGLMLGAFFMATDMVTSPMTDKGAIVFAIGCGVITSVIRIWGNYPEGVSFSILFMNALVPLIDRVCSKRPFGYVRKKA